MTDGERRLKPAWEKPELVGALVAQAAEWERRLQAPSFAFDPGVQELLRRASELEPACRGAGFGGVAHHLMELCRLARDGRDPSALRSQLGVVQELIGAARATLSSDELARLERPSPSSGAELLEPPPLLSGYIRAANLPSGAAPVVSPRPPPPVGPEGPNAAAPAPPPLLTVHGKRPDGLAAAPPRLDAAPPAGPARPLPGAPEASASASHAPVAAAPSRPRQPNLMVRSVLGLRAFGRKDSAPPVPLPSASAASGSSSVLGLKRASLPAPSGESLPPPALGSGYGGLAPLGAERPGPAPSALDVPRVATRPGQRTPSAMSSAPPRPRPGSSSRVPRRRREEGGETRWWVGALAALGVCTVILGIVLVAITLTRRGEQPGERPDGATTASAQAVTAPGSSTAANADTPRGRLLTDDERFKALLSQVHGRGKESAELRSLLEEQASIAAQAVQPSCVGPQCAALAEVRKLVTSTGKRRVRRRSHSPDSMRSRWLAGLEMPEIPVEDDPRVQKQFEFYTENPQGRETFQQMLFRCGAYRDAIQSTLIRRGLPKDLIAVAYAESSCYPLAKSPVGAEGLWQFIPDAARAYHLRIIPDVVDERHSPQKSTDAALQYFSDLYAKFGAWDLVFAAYNMGPFGLAARLEQVEGDDVGFWELVDAEMLPGETANYAPAIQAIALILNNLQRLKFGATQQRAPQMTMDLVVPPATRMSLVARAAALSLEELRTLNLDIKGASTPNIPNFAVQVPKDSVWQARETLQELLKSGDQSDLCASVNFDWGRQRFTPEMQQECARKLAARAAQLDAPAPDGNEGR